MTQVKCPSCGELVTITYEENRIYQIECKDCELVIRKKECSRESARIYFELINSNRDAWKARAEKAEAERDEWQKKADIPPALKSAIEEMKNVACYYVGASTDEGLAHLGEVVANVWKAWDEWRGEEGKKEGNSDTRT